MNATRRAFLKTAIAVPAAAAVASVPALAATVPMTAAAAPVAEYPFRWWLSTCGGELFSEQFDSKEQALAMLDEYGYGMIAECQQQDFYLAVHGDDIIEMLYGQNEDMMGEDGDFLDVKPEQVTDLGVMVTDAIRAWVGKHNIATTAWTFGQIRNQIDAKPVAKAVRS